VACIGKQVMYMQFCLEILKGSGHFVHTGVHVRIILKSIVEIKVVSIHMCSLLKMAFVGGILCSW
jgi:hypothetical protein